MIGDENERPRPGAPRSPVYGQGPTPPPPAPGPPRPVPQAPVAGPGQVGGMSGNEFFDTAAARWENADPGPMGFAAAHNAQQAAAIREAQRKYNAKQSYGSADSVGAYRKPDGTYDFAGQPGQEGMELYDPNSQASLGYEWGGRRGGAQADVDRYRGMGGAAMGRDAFQANYADANQARALGMDSRQHQTTALDMYRDAAMGRGPSAAQSQFQSGLDQSIAAQMAMANSARGGAAARNAAMMRGQQVAGAQLAGSTAQAAALRAQEQQQAMAGYAGLGSQMRGMDQSQQAQDAAQSQFQAQMQQANRNQNDQTGLAYEQMGMGVNQAQMQGQMGKQGQAANYANMRLGGAEAAKNRAAQQDAQNKQMAGGAISAGMSLLPFLLMGSDIGFKENVKSGSEDVRKTLDKISAKTYDYKEKRGDPGRHVGIIAQDLAKTPMGKAAVVDGPDGKYVRLDRAVGLAIASAADLHKRLKKLENGK